MQTNGGTESEPIAWFWYNLTNPNYGWTAAAYLASFLLYAIVSIVEVIGWAMTLLKDPSGSCFFRWWAETNGYWIMLYAGMLPWLFSLLQISLPGPAGLGGIISAEYGANAVFLTIGNGLMWIVQTTVHIIYVPLLKE